MLKELIFDIYTKCLSYLKLMYKRLQVYFPIITVIAVILVIYVISDNSCNSDRTLNSTHKTVKIDKLDYRHGTQDTINKKVVSTKKPEVLRPVVSYADSIIYQNKYSDKDYELSIKAVALPNSDSLLFSYNLDYFKTEIIRVDTLIITKIDSVIDEKIIDNSKWYDSFWVGAASAVVIIYFILQTGIK